MLYIEVKYPWKASESGNRIPFLWMMLEKVQPNTLQTQRPTNLHINHCTSPRATCYSSAHLTARFRIRQQSTLLEGAEITHGFVPLSRQRPLAQDLSRVCLYTVQSKASCVRFYVLVETSGPSNPCVYKCIIVKDMYGTLCRSEWRTD